MQASEYLILQALAGVFGVAAVCLASAGLATGQCNIKEYDDCITHLFIHYFKLYKKMPEPDEISGAEQPLLYYLYTRPAFLFYYSKKKVFGALGNTLYLKNSLFWGNFTLFPLILSLVLPLFSG